MPRLDFASRLMTWLCMISSVTAFLNRPVACPNQLMHQNIVCDPGQALSSITWYEKISNCRQFQARCRNATTSCLEHCEWGPSCQSNATVSLDTEYVRGIDIRYEMMAEQQRLSFLCCHSEDLKTGILDCDGNSLTELDGYGRPELFSIIAQATSKDYSGDLPIKATFCPVLNIPTCPLEKMKSNFLKPDTLIGGGGGGGGYGLSLLTCYGPKLLPGVRLYGGSMGANEILRNYPSSNDCLLRCKANSQCTGMIYDYSDRNTCYIFTADFVFGGDTRCVSYIACVTPAQAAALQSLG